jgi:hypothetical protein
LTEFRRSSREFRPTPVTVPETHIIPPPGAFAIVASPA